jgi:hypothetical protein
LISIGRNAKQGAVFSGIRIECFPLIVSSRLSTCWAVAIIGEMCKEYVIKPDQGKGTSITKKTQCRRVVMPRHCAEDLQPWCED